MCITGDATRSDEEFQRFLARLAQCPPDYFQVRDKAAADLQVTRRLERAMDALPRAGVLANARFDLAIGAGAAGVVLPEEGLPIASVRQETPRGFVIGKSTHSAAAAFQAAEEGADLVLLGPIFETPSKSKFGAPLSPSVLEDLPEQLPGRAELFLVGGIDLASVTHLAPRRGRFAGVAAIRAFETADPSAVIAAMKAL